MPLKQSDWLGYLFTPSPTANVCGTSTIPVGLTQDVSGSASFSSLHECCPRDRGSYRRPAHRRPPPRAPGLNGQSHEHRDRVRVLTISFDIRVAFSAGGKLFDK